MNLETSEKQFFDYRLLMSVGVSGL